MAGCLLFGAARITIKTYLVYIPLMSNFPERDWKWLNRVRQAALERFCERVLREAAKIAAASTCTSHQRYLQLHELIQERNRVLASVFDDHRRSTALGEAAQIHSLGLLTEEEFAGFSDQTRELILQINRT